MALRETLERTFAALAFAEADQQAAAQEVAGIMPAPSLSMEDTFAAVAMAEANCHAEAREIMGIVPVRRVCCTTFLKDIGLADVPVWYGVAPA